jgi:replication-associated recombination protein RarA
VLQQYLPDALVDRQWYEPSVHGDEAAIGERLTRRPNPKEDAS